MVHFCPLLLAVCKIALCLLSFAKLPFAPFPLPSKWQRLVTRHLLERRRRGVQRMPVQHLLVELEIVFRHTLSRKLLPCPSVAFGSVVGVGVLDGLQQLRFFDREAAEIGVERLDFAIALMRFSPLHVAAQQLGQSPVGRAKHGAAEVQALGYCQPERLRPHHREYQPA